MRSYLAALAFVAASSAVPAAAQVAYIGTSAEAQPAEVAVMLWKLGEQPGSNVKLAITEISPEATYNRGGLPGYNPMKSAMQSNTAAVVAPGRYAVVAYCIYTGRDVRAEVFVDAFAGQKYIVACEGPTPRTAKLRVSQVGG